MEQQYNPTSELFLETPVIYAGFWERFAAVFIDSLIMIIPQIAVTYLLPLGISNVMSFVITWLYSAILESGEGQATFGKRAMGLKVTTVSGQRISFGQATGRHFGKIISAIILLIGYLMMLWDDRKQTLHDKMADTLIVKA